MILELFEQIARKFPEKRSKKDGEGNHTVFIEADAGSLDKLPVVFSLSIAHFSANVSFCIAQPDPCKEGCRLSIRKRGVPCVNLFISESAIVFPSPAENRIVFRPVSGKSTLLVLMT